MTKRIYIEIATGLTIFLFLYAAASKLLEYKEFVGQLGRSPMTTLIAEELALLVPLVEIALAILLMVPRTRLVGLHCSFALMMAFTGYIGIMLMFSPSLPCSCGGILNQMQWHHHLMFNIAYVLILSVAIPLQAKNLNSASERTLVPQTSRR